MIPIYQYAMTYLNPKNLTWINNFHGRILLPDAHTKHILITLVIDSQNFRKLQEWFSHFEQDENITQKRKSNRLLIKRWNFSRICILKAQNSISWTRVIIIWNNAILSLEHKKHEILLQSSKGSLKAKNRSNSLQSNPRCCVCRNMAKLCSYILYKNISLRNLSKLPPGRVYQILQWSSIKHLKSHISIMGINIFWLLERKNIFVEKIYQMMNFDTNSIGCHLSCLLL